MQGGSNRLTCRYLYTEKNFDKTEKFLLVNNESHVTEFIRYQIPERKLHSPKATLNSWIFVILSEKKFQVRRICNTQSVLDYT